MLSAVNNGPNGKVDCDDAVGCKWHDILVSSTRPSSSTLLWVVAVGENNSFHSLFDRCSPLSMSFSSGGCCCESSGNVKCCPFSPPLRSCNSQRGVGGSDEKDGDSGGEKGGF